MPRGKAILCVVAMDVILYLIVIGTAGRIHWESPITWIAIVVLNVGTYFALRFKTLDSN